VEVFIITDLSARSDKPEPTLKSSFFGLSGIVEYPEEKRENPVPGEHLCHPTTEPPNRPKCLCQNYDTIEDLTSSRPTGVVGV